MKIKIQEPRYWMAIGLGIVSAILLFGLFSGNSVDARSHRRASEPLVHISTGTIKEGQNLAFVLAEEDVPSKTVVAVQQALSKFVNLRKDIRPGHQYTLVTSTTGAFRQFIYRIGLKRFYTVNRSSAGVYSCEKNVKKTVWMEKRIALRLDKGQTIYSTLKNQGYSERFVGNLLEGLENKIFAWQIDFFSEQRVNDELELLLEQEYVVGSDKPVPGSQRILLATYIGSGTKKKENTAVRYDPSGENRPQYFDLNGKANKKAFRRSPFKRGNFRISSGFSRRRFHPIKRVYRAHHGIDYAAVKGTRVVSVGKGSVVFAGWKGSYGKCIDIRHSKKYTTRYGHLSRIGVKKGQTIEEGQYIGNVGSTGLSTGPHLHFEMMEYGKKKNFLRMSFPSAKSVAAKNLDQFKRVRDQYLTRLNRYRDLAAL